MAFVPGRLLVRLRRLLPVFVVGYLAACGGGEPEQSTVEQDGPRHFAEFIPETAVPEGEEEAQEAVRPFLPPAMARSTRLETFPHNAHAEIQCLGCHQRPAGHGAHGDVDCGSCHRNSATATRTDLTRADCQTCHHGTQQDISCVRCHELPAPRAVSQELQLSVWSTPRSRELPFQHEPHADLGCRTCHMPPPDLRPNLPCAACHDAGHHRPTADCAVCHGTSIIQYHDLDSHQTCSASGCHNQPTIEAIALLSRGVCVSCHQDQRDHRAGQDCAECHQVRMTLQGESP